VVQLFQKNNIVALGFLFLFAFLLNISFFSDVEPNKLAILNFHQGWFFSLNWLKNFYQANPLFYKLGSIIIVVLLSIYIQYVVVEEKLVIQKNFMPAAAFIIYTSIFSQNIFFSTSTIAAILIFLSFTWLLKIQNKTKIIFGALKIGFVIGLASFFNAYYCFFILVALILFTYLRSVNFRELLALIAGFISPFYFFFGIEYVLHGKSIFLQNNIFKGYFPSEILNTPALITFLFITLLLVNMGLYVRVNAEVRNAMQIRKKWNAVLLYFIFSLLTAIFHPAFISHKWIAVCLPFSIILSSAFINNRAKYNTFTFYFTLLSALVIQWFLQ
jgi:hypothetical protein